MDATMRFHQPLARTALGLVLLHPFLYTLPILQAPPPWDPTAAGWLGLGGRAVATGALAWVGLGALVLTGTGRDRLGWRYETWRLGHGRGALVVAAAALRRTLTAGRHAQDPALAWLWAGLAAAAGATLLWVWPLAPLLRFGAPFRVATVRMVAERTWALTVAREDGRPFRYAAGQCVWLRVAPHPFGVADNPFSISSAPAEGGPVAFLIKEAGDFTDRVGALRPGSSMRRRSARLSATSRTCAAGASCSAGRRA
jgi:predicted ferric reductase